MSATETRHIGPYRIDREIGRGGMGVVYLAHDTRLERAVALKALPEDVEADPERQQRFEREAKVLASLNHPNIAAIYDVVMAGGHRYLALEYVEGESLAERTARGPLPLSETLDLCIQIAAGIEAAHESGIIHRDLKPANVVITSGEQVKVIDFGLARGRVAGEGPGGAALLRDSPTLAESPTLVDSPTLQSPATLPGVILGTASYLSPEQARGKPVDRRTDIWAFGCILYECLTGRMAFQGETVSDLIAKILERDVDWSLLPKGTPPAIRLLLQRCLEKDPRRRLRDIGDARLTLEDVRAAGPGGGIAPAAAQAARHRMAAVAVAAFALGAAIAVGAWSLLGPGWGARKADVSTLSIELPGNLRMMGSDLTPDGRTLVVLGQPRQSGGSEPPKSQVYLRHLDSPDFEPLKGTEGALAMGVTADGKWLGFAAPIAEHSAQVRIYRIPLDGSSPPSAVVDYDPNWYGSAAFLESHDILIAVNQGRAYVRLRGGFGPASETKPFRAPGYEGLFTMAKALPRDRGVLLNAVWYEGPAFHLGIGVLDLRTGKSKLLLQDAGNPRYAGKDLLLFTRGSTLYAIRFDLGKLEVQGSPVAVTDGLRVGAGVLNALFTLSDNGTLIYIPGGAVGQDRHVIVAEAGGAVSEWSGDHEAFESSPVSLSPDGTRLAATAINARQLDEIWISERGRPTSRRLVAVPGADCYNPVWSPDGKRIAYSQAAMNEQDGVYVVDADGGGAPRRIFPRPANGPNVALSSWSPDGRRLLGHIQTGGQYQVLDIDATPAPGPPPEARPFLPGPGQRLSAHFSPDGRWVAYTSDESGRMEVYVCAYGSNGATGEPLLVSPSGGEVPRWGRDGRRLYFRSSEKDALYSVAISTQPRLSASAPAPMWDFGKLRVAGSSFDLLPDGRLIAIQRGAGEDDITRYDVVLNFTEELDRRTRAARR